MAIAKLYPPGFSLMDEVCGLLASTKLANEDFEIEEAGVEKFVDDLPLYQEEIREEASKEELNVEMIQEKTQEREKANEEEVTARSATKATLISACLTPLPASSHVSEVLNKKKTPKKRGRKPKTLAINARVEEKVKESKKSNQKYNLSSKKQ